MEKGKNMLNVVIIDNEIPSLNLLKMFLERSGQVNVLAAFTEPNEALKNIINIKPDVVFLDIEMPEVNGLELANHLIKQDDELMVVFVTGYNQYAFEAFQVNAFDYILKPANLNSIQKCVSRLMKFWIRRNKEKTIGIEKKICCFEDFKVYGDSGIVKWPTRKVEEILAYFVVHRNSDVEGWALGEILWPEEEPDKIKAKLHTSIFRLRKTIRENNLPIEIHSEKGGNGVYRCSLHKLSCDLTTFENIVLRNFIINKDNIDEFEQACLLYKDDLFSKKNYEWCESKKEYLRQAYLNTLRNIASFYMEENLHQNALEKLLLAKRISPFDEEIHRRILSIYAVQKNRALLINCNDEFKSKLFREIGVKPQEETRKLFTKLLDEL